MGPRWVPVSVLIQKQAQERGSEQVQEPVSAKRLVLVRVLMPVQWLAQALRRESHQTPISAWP